MNVVRHLCVIRLGGLLGWTALAVATLAPGPAVAASDPAPLRVAAVQGGDLQTWDTRLARMLDTGELRTFRVQEDLLVPSRRHLRQVSRCL